MVTEQSTKYPKLIVLGGDYVSDAFDYKDDSRSKVFLEYELRDIIGQNNFDRFHFDFIKVNIN